MSVLKRVLFLDLDGVLNNAKQFKTRGPYKDNITPYGYMLHNIDAGLVENLSHIAANVPQLHIVFSSSWRDKGPKMFTAALRERGYVGPDVTERTLDPVADRVAYRKAFGRGSSGSGGLIVSTSREREICHWLRTNLWWSWVAIDDDDLRFDKSPHRFVRTTFAEGLTRERAEMAIRVLEEEAT